MENTLESIKDLPLAKCGNCSRPIFRWTMPKVVHVHASTANGDLVKMMLCPDCGSWRSVRFTGNAGN